MSIDYKRVGQRLAAARRRRAAAVEHASMAKEAIRQADGDIEECLIELETGVPQRPLLDVMEHAGDEAKPSKPRKPRSPRKAVDQVEASPA
jgi:hypothetical protein